MKILGLQPRDKVVMSRGLNNRIFSRRICMKIEFTFQRREVLLLFTTNMAAANYNLLIFLQMSRALSICCGCRLIDFIVKKKN